MLVARADSRRTIERCTISAKSRDSSILLFSAIARTISGRLCMARLDAGVLARGDRFGVRIGGEVQEVGFDPLRLRVAAGVGVNRQKQVGPFAIGDRGSLLERNEHVGVARQHDLDARLLLSSRLNRERDVERELRFADTVRPARRDRGRHVPASMTTRETPRPSWRDNENLPSEFADGSVGIGEVTIVGFAADGRAAGAGGARRNRCSGHR